MTELTPPIMADGPKVDPAVLDAWSRVQGSAEIQSRGWLAQTMPLALHGSTLMVAVPSPFTRERLETKLRPWIEKQLSESLGRPTRLAIAIHPELDDDHDQAEDLDDTSDEPAAEQPPLLAVPPVGTGASKSRDGDRLNPKYSFETFVIGQSNRFAHAAAVAVAEAPGKAYNPLMIYGDSGLGKTHLLHALGHYVRNYHDRLRVKYVSTEEMTNDFINAISENSTAQFRRVYREIDVLLIDDIQFLE